MRGVHSLTGTDQVQLRNVSREPDGHEADLLKEICLTPALLTANSQMRDEAVQAIFNQADFCFFQLVDLHHFLSNLRHDSIGAIRKLKLQMSLEGLFTLFSLGSPGLSWDENVFLENLRASFASPNTFAINRIGVKIRIRTAAAKNAEIFSHIASAMRLTHLIVDMSHLRGRFRHAENGNLAFDQGPPATVPPGFPPPGFNGSNLPAHAALGPSIPILDTNNDDMTKHLAHLLLLKLINFTLDFWKRENSSDRPQLHLVWPEDTSLDRLKEFDVIGQHYANIDISQLLESFRSGK